MDEVVVDDQIMSFHLNDNKRRRGSTSENPRVKRHRSDSGVTDDHICILSGEQEEQASQNGDPSTGESACDDHDSQSKVSESDDVCYGLLANTKCQQFRSVTSQQVQHEREFTEVRLQKDDARFLVSLTDGCKFAVLNCKAAAAFSLLNQGARFTLKPYLKTQDMMKSSGRRAGSSSLPRVIEVCINIHGPLSDKETAGKCLSDHGMFLQDPLWISPGARYTNPQALEFADLSEKDILMSELSLYGAAELSVCSQPWDLVLDDLPEHRTTPHTFDEALLTVPLLEHQLIAYGFMVQREKYDQRSEKFLFWRREKHEGALIYRHVVNDAVRKERPLEPRGGILADDMGLGKTLSTLSVIVGSLGRACDFAFDHGMPQLTTKATLVVVPSLLLLDDWSREVESRIKPGTIRVIKYHGLDRTKAVADLREQDVVLTTYGTITTEYRKARSKSLLHSLRWFRIVLDEAHTIRSQHTKQFDAILSLKALHRWCLTGTPIVNRVEDLGALLRFCEVPLLEEPKCFRETIVQNSKRSFRQCCAVLRQTLAPLCLRRIKTKTILDLPEPILRPCRVDLSPSERAAYQDILRHSKKAIDDRVSKRKDGSKHFSVLEAIMQLRRTCNHGTMVDASGSDIDADELLTLRQEDESAYCVCCHSTVTSINQMNDTASALIGTCDHLVCRACLDANDSAYDAQQFFCPGCEKVVKRKELNSGRVEDELRDRPGGYSSKLTQLIADLKTTQGHEKSLVFSVWKKTIDIASTLCVEAGIRYVRIDGTIPQAQRKQAIRSFREDPNTSTLLMTLGTGALGLNLTAATRIHILEPQWNPAVEEQAIGRAVRLGQAHQTTVIRYIVRYSVEEQIQGYQKRKMQLAASGFEEHSDDQTEAQTKLLTAAFLQDQALPVTEEQ